MNSFTRRQAVVCLCGFLPIFSGTGTNHQSLENIHNSKDELQLLASLTSVSGPAKLISKDYAGRHYTSTDNPMKASFLTVCNAQTHTVY